MSFILINFYVHFQRCDLIFPGVVGKPLSEDELTKLIGTFERKPLAEEFVVISGVSKDECQFIARKNGHMNPSGYILIAELVDSYIYYIVRHNPKDFERVAFINPPESDCELLKKEY